MVMLERTLDDRWTGGPRRRVPPTARMTSPPSPPPQGWRDRLADAADLVRHGATVLGLAGSRGDTLLSAPETLLLVSADGIVMRASDMTRDVVLPSDGDIEDLIAAFRTRITDPADGTTRRFGLAVTDDVALVFDLAVAPASPSRQRQRISEDAGSESPFGPEATLIVHSDLDHPGDAGSVRVAVVDRERIDALVEGLADVGLYTESVTVLDHATGRIELIGRPDWLPRPAEGWLTRWRRVPTALRLTCLAVAIVVASMTANLAVTRGKLWVMEAETADALAAARSAGRVETDLRRIEALRHDTLALLRVLDSLARTLPDGTWLDTVEVNEGVIKIGGYAPSAAETLSRVAAVPGLAKVEQSAAVTRDPGGRTEKWRIQATITRSRTP